MPNRYGEDLSVRVENCLRELGIKDLKELKRYSPRDLLGIKNFGRHSYYELKRVLGRRKINLKMSRCPHCGQYLKSR